MDSLLLFVCLFICSFCLFVCLFICLFVWKFDFKIVKYNLTNFSLSRLSQENLRMTSSLSWLASSPAASSSLEGLPRSHHGGDHHSHRKDSCGALQETWGEGGEETVRRGGLWRESKNTGGNRSRVKYSDKRWGGGVSGNMDRDKMSLSADAPRNPVMAQLYDVWRGGGVTFFNTSAQNKATIPIVNPSGQMERGMLLPSELQTKLTAGFLRPSYTDGDNIDEWWTLKFLRVGNSYIYRLCGIFYIVILI